MPPRKMIIIGKRSNLSRSLAARVEGARLVGSHELCTLPTLLAESGPCDLIYNVFYKSALLDQISAPELYEKYAFTSLAEFVSICLEHLDNINTVLFTSTSAVYGNNRRASEAHKTDITNLYASLKLSSEFFLKEHFKDTPIRLVTARVFNMYGGDDEFSVVSKVASALVDGAEIAVNNNGSSVRDFIHISDVVEIYLKLLQSSREGVVNVATGEGISVDQLIEMAQSIFQRRLNIAHVRRDEITHSIACTDLLKRTIGDYSFKKVGSYFDHYYSDCVPQKREKENL
jgi:UDP-glucose 4-epimerase